MNMNDEQKRDGKFNIFISICRTMMVLIVWFAIKRAIEVVEVSTRSQTYRRTCSPGHSLTWGFDCSCGQHQYLPRYRLHLFRQQLHFVELIVTDQDSTVQHNHHTGMALRGYLCDTWHEYHLHHKACRRELTNDQTLHNDCFLLDKCNRLRRTGCACTATTGMHCLTIPNLEKR